MSFSRAFQWYHSHLDPIWPDGTFKRWPPDVQALRYLFYSCSMNSCQDTLKGFMLLSWRWPFDIIKNTFSVHIVCPMALLNTTFRPISVLINKIKAGRRPKTIFMTTFIIVFALQKLHFRDFVKASLLFNRGKRVEKNVKLSSYPFLASPVYYPSVHVPSLASPAVYLP